MGHYDDIRDAYEEHAKKLNRERRKTAFLNTEVEALFDTVDALRDNIIWLKPESLSITREQHRFLDNIQELIRKLP